MPRMRSVLSSSVTTSRVWPDCDAALQRGLRRPPRRRRSPPPGSASSRCAPPARAGGRRRASITASPGSSVPPAALRAIRNFRSSEVVVSSPSASGSHPERPQRSMFAQPSTATTMNGLERHAEEPRAAATDGGRRPRRGRSCRSSATSSPKVMCSGRDQQVGEDRAAITTATPCASTSAERLARAVRDRGLAEAPMPIEASVMPTWQAAMYSSIRSIWRVASLAPAHALVGHRLEPVEPRAHERVLGGDEEAVQRYQRRARRPAAGPMSSRRPSQRAAAMRSNWR